MQTFPTRAAGLDVHEVPDGYIIYKGASDTVCYLNDTAAVVFEFCDGKRGVDEIVKSVAELYELPAGECSELRQCMDKLISEGLVQSALS